MPLALLLVLSAADCTKQKNPLLAAKCEQKAGRYVEALKRLERTKSKRADKLREELIAQVTTYEIFTEPEGAAVTIDGAALSPPLLVNPGHHALHAELQGYRPVDRDDVAVAGTHPKVTLVLDALPQPEPEAVEQAVLVAEPDAPAPAAATAVAHVEPHHSPLPFILGGAGLAAIVPGGVLLLTSEVQHVEGGRRMAAYALLGTGAALVVSALVWLLVERRPGADLR
jgi:hypothetical protein